MQLISGGNRIHDILVYIWILCLDLNHVCTNSEAFIDRDVIGRVNEQWRIVVGILENINISDLTMIKELVVAYWQGTFLMSIFC